MALTHWPNVLWGLDFQFDSTEDGRGAEDLLAASQRLLIETGHHLQFCDSPYMVSQRQADS